MGDMETTLLDTNEATSCCAMCCPIKWRKKKEVPAATSTIGAPLIIEKPTFIGDLPDPLLPGHCIKVTGKPLKDCERFAVNFKCSNNEDSDIGLHFNPRLAENYVVRNSRHNGKWHNEETESLLRLKIQRNQTFTISIFIAPQEFMVSINEKHFCTFAYRIPILKIHVIEILGNVEIDDVEVIEMTSYPTENLPEPIPFEDKYKRQNELPNPFIGHLDKGFQTGWQLEIYGKVKILPHSFYINLQKGSFLWPHPIIPLHLNPRFNAETNNRVLIRNNWDKGWGTEERSPGFYFLPSKPFHLIIQLDLNRELFIVWVNGKLQGEFHIRNKYNAENIDTVYIEGDLTIYKVFMKTSLTDFTNSFDE